MSKKRSLLNLSLDSELLNAIKKQSTAKGVEKLSDYVGDWLMKLGLEKDDIKRVVLQIPSNVLESRDKLEAWLFHRCREIVDHYFKD
jgi:hypothetical protein